jgi:hypothetical protein
MGKHNARRRRRRAECAAAARGASSRERNKDSVSVKVPPPPARRSAMPPCRLRITVAFSSFSCLRPTKHSEWDFIWGIDCLLTQNIYRALRAMFSIALWLRSQRATRCCNYLCSELFAPYQGWFFGSLKLPLYTRTDYTFANRGVPVHHAQTLSDKKRSRGHCENCKNALRRHYCAYYVPGLSTLEIEKLGEKT